MSSDYGFKSVFDDGWASPYELESQRRLEQAKATARARAEQQQSFAQQAIAAVVNSQTGRELESGAHMTTLPGDVAAPCLRGGCQFERAQQMLAQAQQALETSKRIMRRDEMGERTMSRAMWCDQGQHAYSENDPKAEIWTKRVKDPGQPSGWREINMDVCGQCVALGQSPDFNAEERAAIMAGAAPHPAPAGILRRPVPDAPQA